jgi:hypothetical protein
MCRQLYRLAVLVMEVMAKHLLSDTAPAEITSTYLVLKMW